MQTRSAKVDISNLEAPVREFANAYQLFMKKNKASNKNANQQDVQQMWDNLSDKERKMYETEWQKMDWEFKEQIHNFEYQRKGLNPPKFVKPVPKPTPPPSGYNRWVSENAERLRKEWDSIDIPVGRRIAQFYRYQAEQWEQLSEKEKKPFNDAANKERDDYVVRLDQWKAKYGNSEEKPRKKSAKKSRSKSASKGESKREGKKASVKKSKAKATK